MSDNKDCVKIQLLIEEAEQLPKDEAMVVLKAIRSAVAVGNDDWYRIVELAMERIAERQDMQPSNSSYHIANRQITNFVKIMRAAYDIHIFECNNAVPWGLSSTPKSTRRMCCYRRRNRTIISWRCSRNSRPRPRTTTPGVMPLKTQEGSVAPRSAQWRWRYPSKNFKLSLSIVFVCQQVLTFAHDLTVVGFPFIGTVKEARA